MSEVEAQIAPEQSQENLSQSNENHDSEFAIVGGDTNSSLVQSDTNSEHLNSEQENLDSSNAPLSSRGSTKATGEDDSLSMASRYQRGYFGRDLTQYDDEEEKEADGTPILTNKFLRELFRKEHKKYYRTPYLNEKLFLHYKGFHYLKNMEQFTDLKCLYFEGNGLRSLKGLEENRKMLSLFV